MGIIFACFDMLSRSRTAQIIAGVAAFLFGLFLWGNKKKREGRLAERSKAAREAQQILSNIERKTDDLSERAEAARRNAPRIASADSVPDDIAARIFRDPRGRSSV